MHRSWRETVPQPPQWLFFFLKENVFIHTFFFFFVLCLFRSTPTAYGGSQDRGLHQSCCCRPIYARATAMPDLIYIFDLHHSSWQRQILNPLSQGSNLQPHGSWSDLFPMRHYGNSLPTLKFDDLLLEEKQDQLKLPSLR